MPRTTPAPLTVERDVDFDEWIVRSADGAIVAWLIREADARAFVALPALIAVLREDSCLSCGAEPGCNIDCALCAALAQADGPAPTEEK